VLRAGGVAALAAGAATMVPLAASRGVAGTSDFAALVQRYFAELDAFDNDPSEAKFDAPTDFDKTLHQMSDTPIRTAEDALALIEDMLEGVLRRP